MVLLDERRQQTMEALAALRPVRASKTVASGGPAISDKAWTCAGPFFIKMPTSNIKQMLLAGETFFSSTTATAIASLFTRRSSETRRPNVWRRREGRVTGRSGREEGFVAHRAKKKK
jgi:hypothetical protein